MSSSDARESFTVAHVTHEAVEKVGGIGTVLEGMMSSDVYRKSVSRSILVGPMGGHHFGSPMMRFGEHGAVRYSTLDHIDTHGLGRKFHPIERAYNVAIAYGTRQYIDEGSGRSGEAEVLLFDVSNPAEDPLNNFKTRLWKAFGIDAARYQSDWGFEEYCRLAEPAFYALSALIKDSELPCILISHEFMGMCTALKAILDGDDAFRTLFHAHECATARGIVESHKGHDAAFYNILKQAINPENGKQLYVDDVFGDQSGVMRHALISNAWRLDATIAVGDPTADEMRFLNAESNTDKVVTVYNGIPGLPTNRESKEKSRNMLCDWAESLLGDRPDFVMTHVTRPVISKGLWRDLKVMSYLDTLFVKQDETAVLVILTCGAPPRSADAVQQMSTAYNWPAEHREGYPDLVGPELDIYTMVDGFNKVANNVRVVLVNQFGWSRSEVGPAVPEGMTFTDLRRATDVEFGQSVYEPFGIAQLEPLAAGGICVPTTICGCVTSWQHAMKRIGRSTADCPNVLPADYTVLNGAGDLGIDELLAMTMEERSAIEERIAARIATELNSRLARCVDERAELVRSGAEIAGYMDWDTVIKEGLIPLFRKVVDTK